MRRFEEAVSWQFFPRPQFIRFNADVFMRADTKTRYETHAIGIEAGFLQVDEARDYEDKPPLGDQSSLPAPSPVEAQP